MMAVILVNTRGAVKERRHKKKGLQHKLQPFLFVEMRREHRSSYGQARAQNNVVPPWVAT
jgi:hypothetical protein